jgi:L-iditol 2-dehydrogenase
MRFAGHGAEDGALREFVCWPDENIFSIPDSLSLDDGAMLEPLGVAIHASDLGKLKPGMHVGVFGAGPIGLLIQQLVQLSGAQATFVSDVVAHRVEAAQALGATHAILDEAGSSAQEMLETTQGRGLDVAFEAANESAAVDTACQALKPGGLLVLAGIPRGDRTEFQASVARRKGLTIKLVRRMKHTYPRAIQLVKEGRVNVRDLVTHRFPLEEASEAFSLAARREGLKVIIAS